MQAVAAAQIHSQCRVEHYVDIYWFFQYQLRRIRTYRQALILKHIVGALDQLSQNALGCNASGNCLSVLSPYKQVSLWSLQRRIKDKSWKRMFDKSKLSEGR